MSVRQLPWSKIETLFFGALELPADQREAWISQAAADDPQLACEVRSLLDAHADVETAEALRRIGPYRLERLLGRGGMGEVWLASRADGQFEQRVALKLVRSGLGADVLLPRFRQERQLLARLNHPNITRLLDGGVSPDGRPYLVMEYVEGEPILQFAEHRGMDTRARLELFRTLCSAVEYAHQNLIVHRDIKPGNVLVTSGGSPKLLDFGIAKLTESDGVATATALPLLSLRYASPEQVRGEPVTTASDVYSLGVLLFELLTGSLPYSLAGDTVPEVILAVTSREPKRASEVKRDSARALIPRDLDAILAKALEKDPVRRYASVERLSADIGNYLHGLPVQARTLTGAYRLRKYVRRHWVGVAAVCAVVVSLAAAAVVAVRAARVANQQQVRTERVTKFLEDTLGSADPGFEGLALRRGSETKLVDLLAAASARIGTSFADDPAAQARLHRVLGYVYSNLGEFPAAETELKAAMAGLPALESDPVEKTKVLFAAGILDFRMSHRQAEEQEMRQAVEAFESTPSLNAQEAEHAIYLSALAATLADVGKPRESAQYADRAGRILSGLRSPPPTKTGILEYNLALTYMKIGDLERARKHARASVQMLSSTAQPLMELGDVGMFLGIIERSLGNPSGARAALKQSVEASVRALGPDHPLTVPPRIELAYQRALDGEAPQVVAELQRCLAQARAGASKENLFHALHALGYVLTLAGRPRDGEPLLREALRVGPEIVSTKGPSFGRCELELGECLERQGRVAEARVLCQAGSENLRAAYGENVYTTEQAEAQLRRLGAGR